MAMSVDLGEKLESFVTRMVESGRYNSKSEVLREGLRLVEEREARLAIDEALARGDFDEAIAVGLKDIKEGRLIPLEDVRHELATRFGSTDKRAAG